MLCSNAAPLDSPASQSSPQGPLSTADGDKLAEAVCTCGQRAAQRTFAFGKGFGCTSALGYTSLAVDD
jgi:hypothetical protein